MFIAFYQNLSFIYCHPQQKLFIFVGGKIVANKQLIIATLLVDYIKILLIL